MSRYEHTRIKITNVVRGKDTSIPYSNVKSYSTTVYSSIPKSDNDIYVITQMGDRLDLLAQQFYKDQSLWWIISIANDTLSQNSLFIPLGTQLRIPTDIQNVLIEYDTINSF